MVGGGGEVVDVKRIDGKQIFVSSNFGEANREKNGWQRVNSSRPHIWMRILYLLLIVKERLWKPTL